MSRTLIVGCGNILRGDDAVGPVLVRHLWERTLPPHVICADGGTGGMDVAFKMRGMDEVILVDACATGAEPGTLYEVPGEEVEQLRRSKASTCTPSSGTTRWRSRGGC
ncbi:MAG: hydrogenase maturation protease [Vicinamibacterales bacterium]